MRIESPINEPIYKPKPSTLKREMDEPTREVLGWLTRDSEGSERWIEAARRYQSGTVPESWPKSFSRLAKGWTANAHADANWQQIEQYFKARAE